MTSLQEGWTLLDVRPQSEHKKVTFLHVNATLSCSHYKYIPQTSRPLHAAGGVAELYDVFMTLADAGMLDALLYF